MNLLKLPSLKKISGRWTPPPDKSILHRVLLLGSVASGTTRIQNWYPSEHLLSTFNLLKGLGVQSTLDGSALVMEGRGKFGLQNPKQILDARNSGTALRLLSGLLVGQRFSSVITGDASLKNRPMGELIEALQQMGAEIRAEQRDDKAPLWIEPVKTKLRGIQFESALPSAQVKSALLLAALYADGITEIKEKLLTRDHTERWLKEFGADISVKEGVICLNPSNLKGCEGVIPGDLSSASFLLTLSLLLPNSKLEVNSVGLNPTRIGILEVIQRMGGKIQCFIEEETPHGEPSGTIIAESSQLKAITIDEPLMIKSIDEFPLMVLLATQAIGETKICGIRPLRYKESDRVLSISSGLSRMGAEIEVHQDVLYVRGPTPLKGADVQGFSDHRIVMTLVLASLLATGETKIDSLHSIRYSFPDFLEVLLKLGHL